MQHVFAVKALQCQRLARLEGELPRPIPLYTAAALDTPTPIPRIITCLAKQGSY